MPAASSETKEAFDDFDRFARRGAWERATKALYAIPEAQATRFVDGPDGFIIPVARKRRAVLSGLSPEGQAAYRLFYDAEAKKLLDQAEGLAEMLTLEKLYSAYFFTSVGDKAADRLGDLYFEQGRFDRAADCWLAVLRERTDSDLSPSLMAVKAALGLARAGRRAEIEALRGELADRFADELVTIGGRKAKVAEHFQKAAEVKEQARTTSGSSRSSEPWPTANSRRKPSLAWQLRFGASVTAGMTPPKQLVQWESNPPERRRAGGDGPRAEALCQLSRLHFRHRPHDRQNALALGLVPQSGVDGEPEPDDRHQTFRDPRRRRVCLDPGPRPERP